LLKLTQTFGISFAYTRLIVMAL